MAIDPRLDEEVTCYLCCARIANQDTPAYQVDADRVLCANCAGLLGGVYSFEEDRWVQPPNVGWDSVGSP